jgi:hypothetical protein
MQLESLQVGVLSTRTLRQAQAGSHGNSPESGLHFEKRYRTPGKVAD